ncbi:MULTISPECIES: cupin domain-containing protein [Clavibacter]|uniref:cupin domain-containing protein n=1 Tax=Clavibacter TaxID=1573 RepID=UPI001BE09A2C|nr:cupin domain-containing protein [Clavibacter michiganensis]MBT1634361.1 cupin domain-containing protein [Clavibacter michiganensis]
MRVQAETPAVTMPAHQFTGEVRLRWLSTPQTADQRAVVAAVTFAPGARTVWHSHVLGQTLHVTSGIARVGTRDGGVVEVAPGGSVYIEAGEEHWHGATAHAPMEHIAVLEDGDDPVAATGWGAHVTDEEFLQPAVPASVATPTATPAAGHHVPLGAPVLVHALRYTAMYGEKPFDEALLVYLDNGSYKILSPGEEHYGSYVSASEPGVAPRHVAFLSWPSDDWHRNVASHTLTFSDDTGAFIQSLVLPGDAVPRAQHGFAEVVADPERVDMTASWETLRVTHAAAFERLAERVRGL